MNKKLALELIRRERELLNLQANNLYGKIDIYEKKLKDTEIELSKIKNEIQVALDIEDLIDEQEEK